MFMRGKGTDILSAWVGFFLTVDSCRVTVFFFVLVRRAREIYKLYCERRLAQLGEHREFQIPVGRRFKFGTSSLHFYERRSLWTRRNSG